MSGSDIAQRQASAALDSYLEPDTESQNAISGFVQPVYDQYAEKLPNENQLADSLESLWTALLDKVLLVPYHDSRQDLIVTFIKVIKSLPPPDQPAPQIWGLSLWSDLPVLGAAIRQRWNIGPRALNDGWLNLNAFAARLTTSRTLDLSLYAIWAMRDALETPLEDIRSERRDQTLRAAALWIELCGEYVRLTEQIWEADPRKGDVAKGGPLYTGPKGFCKERWGFWREKFQVLSREEGLEEKTRQILADVATKMSV